MRNVILSGGIYHPFAQTSQWLAQRWSEAGVESVITEDVGEAVSELQAADCLTINALRWRMLNDPKYQPHRRKWAFEMPEDWAARIGEFVEQGGALLALHTASICFDTWYDYGALLGGRWVWQQSHHPDPGHCAIRAAGDHVIIAEPRLHGFETIDEVYHLLERAPDSVPLLQGRVADSVDAAPETGIGEWQTLAWCRQEGEGRVLYCALGHDVDALSQPGPELFIDRSIAWLIGEL